MNVTVSAIIPALNAATTIGRAIESALTQTTAVTEIIVVDDGSQDNTSRIAKSYGVKVKSLPRQSGAAIARNIAIEAAVGEYLAFLDADDEWLPNKISKQLKALKPQTVLVSCHSLLVSDRPNVNLLVNYDRPPATGSDAWKTLLAYSFISTTSVLARRNDVIAVGMFDQNTCPAEDQDLWIKLARRGEVEFINDILVRYYDTAGSVTKKQAAKGRAKVIEIMERNIADAGSLLTEQEKRRIRGLRYTWLGRDAYAQGDIRQGFSMLMRAIALGHEPFTNLRYLAVASAPARLAKHWLAV